MGGGVGEQKKERVTVNFLKSAAILFTVTVTDYTVRRSSRNLLVAALTFL